MPRKILALLLVALMLVVVFISCATPDTPDDEQTTPQVQSTTEETTTEEPKPTFVDKTYNEDFVVYSRPADAANYPGFYIYSDTTDTLMSSAVYTRNVTVEEKYGVKIKQVEHDNPEKSVPADIASGTVPYDVLLAKRINMKSIMLQGYLYDFNNLDYVDFEQPWWDINCKEGYEIDGKLYMMANDISVSNISSVRFFYFNRKMIADYNLEDPYTLIENNQWTLDKLLTLITSVSHDRDGNGIMDSHDDYGFLNETPSLVLHQLVGCGQTYLEKQPDGTLTTNIYNEKTQTILDKIYNSVDSTNNYALTYQEACAKYDIGDMNVFNYARTMLFTTDHYLFVHSSLGTAHQYAEMESDYGVAPNPKYDTSQDRYYHRFDNNGIIWAIPNANMNYDKIGAVMEYWAYVSSSTVMPAYYEITIKTKRVKDDIAPKMIDLIKGSMCYDANDIINPGVTDIIKAGYGNNTLASTWESRKESVQTKINDVYEQIKAIPDN